MIKQNWLRGKIQFIRDVILNAVENDSVEEALSHLEFRNEEEHAKLKPTKSNPKEVSFIKNNPREKEMNKDPNAAASSTGPEAGSGATLTLADIQKQAR